MFLVSLLALWNLEPLSSAGQYTKLVRARNGFPQVAYHDEWLSSLRLTSCENALCSSRSSTVIDSALGHHLGRFEDAARCENVNRTVFSYWSDDGLFCATVGQGKKHIRKLWSGKGAYGSIGASAEVAFWSGDGCVRLADESGMRKLSCSPGELENGKYPSLAGREAFFRGGNRTLSRVHLDSGRVTIIDAGPADVGRYTAAAVMMADVFVIYTDSTHGALKMARCQVDGPCNVTILDPDIRGGTVEQTRCTKDEHFGPYGVFPSVRLGPKGVYASYFAQVSHEVGCVRIVSLNDAIPAPLTVACGKCGFGRDSDVMFADNGLVYLSFLDYNQNGVFMHPKLAVFKLPDE